MHKPLLILGLLQRGPMSGYDIHQILHAHGELYADLKKANLYYLLERMAHEGYLHVTAEAGARGRRGERLIYSLTERGRTHFYELMRQVLRSYQPVHTGLETAIVFLEQLPHTEAVALLEERQRMVAQRLEIAVAEAGDLAERMSLVGMAMDHLLALIRAELAWTERTLARLRAWNWVNSAGAAAQMAQRQEEEA